MRILIAVALVLFVSAMAFGQARPGDSIILESKVVAPGFYSGGGSDTAAYLYVKTYITSQDSLTYLTLALKEVSTSGGAYGILGYPRSLPGIINFLSPYFRAQMAAALNKYNSSSPDSFLIAGGFDPADPSNIAPPFPVRTPIWEIKFDSVWNNPGTFELDSATLFGLSPTFTDTGPTDWPVNFVKSVITVLPPPPDPRDSIILESKTVVPGSGHPYTTIKVYLTNKDSIIALYLALRESTIVGNAYAILATPRTFNGVVTALTYLKFTNTGGFINYNNSSPDRFGLFGEWDPAFGPSTYFTVEPPHNIRTPVWEIKFDTVLSEPGIIELDTARFPNWYTGMYSLRGGEVPFNFLKSTITVSLYPKGDLNQDVALSPADVVWILNCVMLGTPPPGGVSSCDVNCDGMGTPADIVLELNAVFLGEGFPC